MQPLWRTVWRVLNKLKVELAHGPTLIWKDTCTPVFTAALFTIAKTWKQPKYPSTYVWIKKMCCIYIYVCVYIYMCVCIHTCVYTYICMCNIYMKWKWKSFRHVRLFANPWTDSLVCGILQARVLEWVAIPFSRGSSRPRNRTGVSCIAGVFFTSWATREDINIQWNTNQS